MNDKELIIDNKLDSKGTPKLRYLIISPAGLGLFMIPRLSASPDVDKVYFWTPDLDAQVGKKLEEVPGWEKLDRLGDFGHALNHVKTHKPQDDLIIVFDDNGYGETAYNLRLQGHKVIGGGIWDEKMEDDRMYAAKFMKRFMKVPETYEFTSFTDGLAFLKGKPKEERWVFKPSDSAVPKEYSYPAKDIPDLISAMEQFKKAWKWEEKFILQVFIEGTEVDFNAYFNGNDWMEDSLMVYFENKPLGNDDKGPATGGSVAVQLPRPLQGKFFEILDGLKPTLRQVKYRGCFAVNSIVSDKDKEPYFIEATPRFGYPSLPLDITLLEDKGKTLDQFFRALTSDKTTSFFPTNKIAATVSIFKMPYPDTKDAAKVNEGVPMSWSKKYDKYFFPYYIKGDKGKMVLAGDSGSVLQCTCVDVTLDGAVSMMYDTYLPTLKLTDAYLRTDCGKSAKKRLAKLREYKIV